MVDGIIDEELGLEVAIIGVSDPKLDKKKLAKNKKFMYETMINI